VRNAIEEVTQNVLLLNWRYTILSLFIPIWCLYRPWLGFAEVRRAATGIARRKSLSPSWRTDGFNFATFALAFVWYVLGCGFSLVIGKVIEQEGDKDITLGTLDLIQRLTTWQIGVDSIFFATLIWYMFSLCRALGSISALVSFTHVSKRSFHGTIAS
jgi:hypothetical protein